MIRLSPTQRDAVAALAIAPLERGRAGWQHPGSIAAWHTSTITALADRGLARVEERPKRHFRAVLTAAGRTQARRQEAA